MEWIRLHPYSSALAIAAALIIVGTLFVESRTSTVTPSSISAWGGGDVPTTDASLSPVPLGNTSNQTNLNTTDYGTRTLPYTSNELGATSSGTIPDNYQYNAADFKAFVAKLLRQSSNSAKSAVSNVPANAGIDATNPWDYIPSGLISTNVPPAKTQTATQQALFQYGNEIGTLVQQYDIDHYNQVQTLKDAMASRNDSSKQSGLLQVGEDLETTGTDIAQLENIPSIAKTNNAALAKSYTDSGKKLILIAQALPGYDGDLVKAIQSYDGTVDGFVKNYVALAGVFSNYGVTFGPNDAGNVFSFTPNAL
jgi:hypothetical protein